MSKFIDETGRVAPALGDFLASERERLTKAPGNICNPAHDRGVEPHDPFQRYNYPYIHELGTFSSKPWNVLLKQTPEDLIPADPFEVSRVRGPGHSQLWDAGICVPACSHRKCNLVGLRDLPVLRNSNTHWSGNMHEALGHAGVEINGKCTRIQGPWIFDLTTMGEYGWFLAEAMHAWAHYRADFKALTKGAAVMVDSKTIGRLQQALGLLAVSHFYGLPLFIGEEIEDTRAYSYFRQYGIDVKTTTEFTNPIVAEPWIGNEAPRFDHTLATVVVAIRIEPPPLALHTGIVQSRPEDRWAGFPTMAAIVGWERMDVTLHQPLVAYYPDNPDSTPCYGLHPADLMTPESFWSFLALGRRARGLPIVDDQNMTFENWMLSPHGIARINETPPRPCSPCLGWQKRSEAYHKRPKKYASKAEKEAYHKDVLTFRKVVRKAERDYQAKIYGSNTARNRVNKQRNAAHKLKLERDRQKKLLMEAKQKVKDGKQLTERQQNAYTPYREMIRNRKENECSIT